MSEFSAVSVDEHMTSEGKIRCDPSDLLALQPKKSILKMKQPPSLEKDQDGHAHFDEMNILATHHPADKDYGHMKIEEPKTPYHHSDHESGDEAGGSKRRVSLAGVVEEKLLAGLGETREAPMIDDSDDEGDAPLTEEAQQRKHCFEKQRKLHYNEGAVLKQHLPIEDDDDEEEKMH